MISFNTPYPHLFAHRGGKAAGEKKENTFSAFQSAVNSGCNFLETDVIVTKDQQVITYHGSANILMKSIFGLEIRRKAQKLNYDQLKNTVKLNGETIPKFKDVLSKFKDQCFSIDVKTNEAVEPLVDIIKKCKAEKRVIVTSFSKRRSLKVHKLLYGEDFKNACICVYRMRGWLIANFPTIMLARLKKQGFGYAHIPYRCVTKKLIKEAKKQNFKVYAWTVNNEKDIKKLLSWKIDGIISDEVELLVKFKKAL